jgi:hypothetical protein
LQNLSKRKKKNKKEIDKYGKSIDHPSLSQTSEILLPQTAVLDEPDTADADDVPNEGDASDNSDSKGSSVEILDGGSDADIHEETELMKFSRMLCDAQKKAQAEERAKGKKRKPYNGHSCATEDHQKRYRRDLAAQGYLPVQEFMKQMGAQKKEELTVEESEESSGNNAITVCRLECNQPSMSRGTQVTASGDRPRVVQGPAASEEDHQITQGPAASEEDRCQIVQGPVASGNHC